jgi:GT2 family glycosyltransferase
METALRTGTKEAVGHEGTGAGRRAAWPNLAPPGRQVHAVPRPRAGGKFIFAGAEKEFVRGVTYGAFRPDAQGNEYHDLLRIERDFTQMAANGINTVRIPHTMPPRALLDAALRHGLRVMVGLSAEQYVGYLIDRKNAPDIEALIRLKVRACAGHPALLCYALGNEIPAPLVRWLGPDRITRYLRRLYEVVKGEDPAGLVTYVNYPTTEYLELPFLDLVCFNVYLESPDRLEAYLARLQNIAGDRPLILSEVGLDSLRNGQEAQAQSLDCQIRTAFGGGCAGVFVFAWTDEWHRGGVDVDDWQFGLTDREGRPKPALHAVRRAFAEVPFRPRPWPRVSVVVCTHNGSRTIRDCLEGLLRLEYSDFEVIVVDDGSTDGTGTLVRHYPVRLIRTANRGLSHARNTGLAAATGEIVAYLDDDAAPDPHWLQYLAATFRRTCHAGVGGPNVPPAGDGVIADCVANAPGGPVHVLLSDCEAEHIPGCNMAFRKRLLEKIGGFDPQFRVAGDDVDVCWRLQEIGCTLGFHPAAMVWHHRRNSVLAYWKQQCGYGRAEALLQKKWPDKYNGTGQLTWAGRIYSRGLTRSITLGRGRIYHGTWGVAPFQRLYLPRPGTLYSLTLIPEWYLAIPILAALSLLGVLWSPLLLAAPLLAAAVLVTLIQAWLSTAQASFTSTPASRSPLARIRRLGRRVMTALLHVLHPIARLLGRLQLGRLQGESRGEVRGIRRTWPRARAFVRWTERGERRHQLLPRIEQMLRAGGAVVRRGGDWDRWDLEVAGGRLGVVRLIVAVEDHGAGARLQRWRWWPRLRLPWLSLMLGLGVLAAAAAAADGGVVATILGAGAAAIAIGAAGQCGAAAAVVECAVRGLG